MAYLALYREWRPQLFQEIVGQEHVTRTLQNALASGRVSHAYLFCGPRGTGKTTIAKIMAKALNCSNKRFAEPCNRCENCLEIIAGTSMDVIEIDAASHRGIDEIRDLKEKIKFAPAKGRYRVYIIDEVHMLTQEAFNALLKTLEEPPEHVVFILATTEPHKVPLTILSRCQRFDFHRLGVQQIINRLKEVAVKTGIQVEESVYYAIARAAEGGLRDALSILDQLIAYGEKRIVLEDVQKILGAVQEEILEEVANALGSFDAAKALILVANLVEQGKDLRLFVKELLARFRQLLLLLISPEIEELSSTKKDKLVIQAKTLGQERLLLLLELFSQVEQEMRWSSQPRILLEIALVRATRTVKSNADLLQRISLLEELVEKLISGKVNKAFQQNIVTKDKKEVDNEAKEKNYQKKVLLKDDNEQIVSRWPEFLDFLKKVDMPLYVYLLKSWPVQLKDNCLVIGFVKEDEFFKKYLETSVKKVCKAISSFFNKNWQVRFIYDEPPQHMIIQDKELSTDEALSLFGLSQKEELKYEHE